jgi:hypothetical protein
VLFLTESLYNSTADSYEIAQGLKMGLIRDGRQTILAMMEFSLPEEIIGGREY